MPTVLKAPYPEPLIVTADQRAAGFGVTEHVAVLGGGVDPPPFLPLALAPRASTFTATRAETRIADTAINASSPSGFLFVTIVSYLLFGRFYPGFKRETPVIGRDYIRKVNVWIVRG